MPTLAPSTFDIAHLIQISIGPVFLLSGIAATLNVLTSRLARIVDRARQQEQEAVLGHENAAELRAQLTVLARRARHINAAIALATLSALLVALTVVLLFANPLVHSDLSIVVAVVFVGALLALVVALLSFLIEVRIATAALRIGKGFEPV